MLQIEDHHTWDDSEIKIWGDMGLSDFQGLSDDERV